MSFRSRLTKLAFDNPDLRPDLLPLLHTAAGEVDDRTVAKVKRQLDTAQRKLVAITKKIINDTKNLQEGDRYSGGKVEIDTTNSTWTGNISYGSIKEGKMPVVRAFFPWRFKSRHGEELTPALPVLGSNLGLPFKARPYRLTIWNPPADFLKRSMASNPDGTVCVKIYYSREGYGGVSSGFLAVKSDGSWVTGQHA